MTYQEISSFNYTIIQPDYEQLRVLGWDFLDFRGVDMPQLPPDECRAFAAILMAMFKAGESEKYKGIINDFLALLTVMGIEYRPLCLVERK